MRYEGKGLPGDQPKRASVTKFMLY
jgi:hypothetical protein